MKFRKTLKYFLVHKLSISNRTAHLLITSSRIYVNGKTCNSNCEIREVDEVKMDNTIIKSAKILQYFLYYKPVGIECSLSSKIENNLSSASGLSNCFFPVGRLDKDSEGLLVMTNDGDLYKQLTWPFQNKEKEYLVSVNKKINVKKLKVLEDGIQIDNYQTKKCKIKIENEFSFNIILTEGKNRQIRKMCASIGYEVQQLVRLRIDNFHLGELKPGMKKEITRQEFTK